MARQCPAQSESNLHGRPLVTCNILAKRHPRRREIIWNVGPPSGLIVTLWSALERFERVFRRAPVVGVAGVRQMLPGKRKAPPHTLAVIGLLYGVRPSALLD